MTNQPTTGRPPSIKRPFSVTILAGVVLIMASWGWLRLCEVLRQWEYLLSLTPDAPVLYLALIGLIWGLTGTILIWGLILGRPWAPQLMKSSVLLYTIYYWLDRWLVAEPAAISTRWPFALGLNIALLAFTFWVLWRPKARLFFQKTNLTDFDTTT